MARPPLTERSGHCIDSGRSIPAARLLQDAMAVEGLAWPQIYLFYDVQDSSLSFTLLPGSGRFASLTPCGLTCLSVDLGGLGQASPQGSGALQRHRCRLFIQLLIVGRKNALPAAPVKEVECSQRSAIGRVSSLLSVRKSTGRARGENSSVIPCLRGALLRQLCNG